VFTLTDENGAALDLTGGGVSVVFRLKLGSGAAVTRTKGVVGEYAYVTDGTDGGIQFLFSPTETAAMTAGTYAVELVWGDTAPNPDEKVVAAHGRLFLKAALTGTI
jgi:hypothetical protein